MVFASCTKGIILHGYPCLSCCLLHAGHTRSASMGFASLHQCSVTSKRNCTFAGHVRCNGRGQSVLPCPVRSAAASSAAILWDGDVPLATHFARACYDDQSATPHTEARAVLPSPRSLWERSLYHFGTVCLRSRQDPVNPTWNLTGLARAGGLPR